MPRRIATGTCDTLVVDFVFSWPSHHEGSSWKAVTIDEHDSVDGDLPSKPCVRAAVTACASRTGKRLEVGWLNVVRDDGSVVVL